MVFCACGSLMEFGHILRERVLDTMTNLHQQWLAPHRNHQAINRATPINRHTECGPRYYTEKCTYDEPMINVHIFQPDCCFYSVYRHGANVC